MFESFVYFQMDKQVSELRLKISSCVVAGQGCSGRRGVLEEVLNEYRLSMLNQS